MTYTSRKSGVPVASVFYVYVTAAICTSAFVSAFRLSRTPIAIDTKGTYTFFFKGGDIFIYLFTEWTMLTWV